MAVFCAFGIIFFAIFQHFKVAESLYCYDCNGNFSRCYRYRLRMCNNTDIQLPTGIRIPEKCAKLIIDRYNEPPQYIQSCLGEMKMEDIPFNANYGCFPSRIKSVYERKLYCFCRNAAECNYINPNLSDYFGAHKLMPPKSNKEAAKMFRSNQFRCASCSGTRPVCQENETQVCQQKNTCIKIIQHDHAKDIYQFTQKCLSDIDRKWKQFISDESPGCRVMKQTNNILDIIQYEKIVIYCICNKMIECNQYIVEGQDKTIQGRKCFACEGLGNCPAETMVNCPGENNLCVKIKSRIIGGQDYFTRNCFSYMIKYRQDLPKDLQRGCRPALPLHPKADITRDTYCFCDSADSCNDGSQRIYEEISLLSLITLIFLSLLEASCLFE